MTSPRSAALSAAGSVLMASAVPMAAIGWMLASGAASWSAALLVAVATLAVDAVLIRRALQGPFPQSVDQDQRTPERQRDESFLHDDGPEGDWNWQIDAAKTMRAVSPRLAKAFGRKPSELEGMSLMQLLAGESWESGNFTAALRTIADRIKYREPFQNLILPVAVADRTLWFELSGAPFFDAQGSYAGFKGSGTDVTAERHSADKINRMARYDALTGLPNRLHMTEQLGDALFEAEQWRSRCAFLMIDLDRFKGVNDTLGHAVGDRLLGRVAERLSALMTDKDVCGRLGGDEFGVVIKDASDQARVEKLAARIVEELSKPYDVDNHILYVGASVGTALGPRDGNSAETLIRSADLALYRSKDAGGNAVHSYEPQLHLNAEERRVLEIALRRALPNGELHLQYQPVVSAESGKIEGFEALLRWTNPQLGAISPARFIPIAEEARLIGPIGEWVLRTAAKEAMSWPSTVRVAVNVSAALQESGLPAHRLELEVTESVFMNEAPHAVAVLREVLALGVKLSLDDFGTGYSSLGYLSRTQFSTIKIDRSFVQGAARNAPESLAIIRAVVALADSLGMATTAEGVETEDELAMIRTLGCRKIQGYLFGRPMSALDARALFTSGAKAAAA
jgi:diguanylate cyclase (GGDEF)-like protein